MNTLTTDLAKCFYIQDPSIVARQIAGEMILVPIRQNVGDLESIYLLNDTALFAWNHFDGTQSLADICALITSEFDVDPAQAGEDLQDLVAHLEGVGAVRKA